MKKSALFPLGMLVATPGALELLEEAGKNPAEFFSRHVSGDWGEGVDAEDSKSNDLALRQGFRIFSVYKCGTGRLYVITEADRSSTTILLPEDY